MTGFACCASSKWAAIIDLGSTQGFDVILGRCDSCGRYWMKVWSPLAPASRYLPMAGDLARRVSTMPAGEARKRALAAWLDGG
jgi:hypothetical protein